MANVEKMVGVDEEVGECTKCKIIECMDYCKHSISAQLTMKTNDLIISVSAN